MLSMLIGVIGSAVGLAGWFVYKSVPMLIIGTILYGIETIMERDKLTIQAKVLDFLIFVVGAIVGLVIKQPFYITGLIALNIYSGLMGIFGIIGALAFLRR